MFGLELFLFVVFGCAEPPRDVASKERVFLPYGVLLIRHILGVRGVSIAVLG